MVMKKKIKPKPKESKKKSVERPKRKNTINGWL